MLYICSNITKFHEFKERFKKENESIPFLDLSKYPISDLAENSDTILSHHNSLCIFLGHLEPGWMLDFTDQTRLRKLFRKFPVAMITKFVDSIPFSWKNETAIFYHPNPVNGSSNSVNNGRTIQDKP
jgi:hypothetical protein